jgi:hypothetical protein
LKPLPLQPEIFHGGRCRCWRGQGVRRNEKQNENKKGKKIESDSKAEGEQNEKKFLFEREQKFLNSSSFFVF